MHVDSGKVALVFKILDRAHAPEYKLCPDLAGKLHREARIDYDLDPGVAVVKAAYGIGRSLGVGRRLVVNTDKGSEEAWELLYNGQTD